MSRQVVLQEPERGAVVFLPVGVELSCGRDSSQSDIHCRERHVSRRHCLIAGQLDGSLRVKDISTTGTYIDGQRVEGEGLANPGSRLGMGPAFALQVVGAVDAPPLQPPEELPPPPTWLGPRYLLLRLVGKGGMGLVFEAWDSQESARVAIKWMNVGLDDPELVKRFRREALLQGGLRDYPGIVSVHSLEQVPGSGRLFCVMEFVDGEPLLDKIRRGLDRPEAVRLVARVARAVAFAHEHGVVHRDLKPANVLVTHEGGVRLTDFGIAKAMTETGASLHDLTATGIMLGTPGFMAPEQIVNGRDADALSDVYGLGAILYAALTGKPPVKGRNLREMLANVQAGIMDPPRAHDPGVDPALEAITMRALQVDPEDRYPGAVALAEALEGWLRDSQPSAPVNLRPPGA